MSVIKYGANPSQFPPIESHRMLVQAYEQAGLDFLLYCDQACITIPPSIWTPDNAPIAEFVDINAWYDPWLQMTEAALITDRIRLNVTACDVLRRTPFVLAQLAMTLDNYAKGRFTLTLGAGEVKQFRPYGLERDKPFGRLEEAIQILKLLWSTNEPVDREGKFWTLKNALLAASTYTEGGPELLIAGGPGKALKFSAQLADGWTTYYPGSGPAEEYAELVKEFHQLGAAADRDTAGSTVMFTPCVVLGDDDEAVERLTHNAVLRWDCAAMVSSPNDWKRHGEVNPIGENYTYASELIPMDWSREAAMGIVEKVSPEMVRKLRMCGTPEQVAHLIQPFIDAGANHVMALDYGAMIGGGVPQDATRRMAELYSHLRRINHQPEVAARAPAAPVA